MPRAYGLLAASADAVALDAVIARALGYRDGQVLHLTLAQARGLGVADPSAIVVEGSRSTLDFGRVKLPQTHWYYNAPSWATASVHRLARVRPRLLASKCVGCGRCVEVCPAGAISRASQPLDSRGRARRVLSKPPTFDLDVCVGCLCCVEVCPVGALEPQRNWLLRLVGMGR
jgi:ferredoxin